MSPFTAQIENLLGGVSEQPTYRRLPEQAERVKNFLPVPEEGLIKRHSTIHQAIIAQSPTDLTPYSSAFMHTINRDASERYRVILLDGAIRVFDENGTEQTVLTPNGVAYLSSAVNPQQDFRAATVADTTIITNKQVTVAQGTSTSPAKAFEALLFVRDADFDVNYRVTIDGTALTPHRTKKNDDPDGLDSINTTVIATQLAAIINTEAAGFTATVFGSSVHVVKDDATDFTIEAEDGLGGEGFIAIKGKTAKFEDLPPQAPDGFTVEITGDPTTNFDNFYVSYSDSDAIEEQGVWQETVKPGEFISLDPTTMPHELVRNGAVVPQFNAEAALPNPTVRAGSTTLATEGWASSLNGAESQGTEVLTLEGTDEAFSNLDSANGISTQYRVFYDIDASNLSSLSLQVIVWANDGVSSTNWSQVSSRTYYQADGEILDHSQTFTATLSANWDLRVTLDYSDVPLPTELAQVTMNRVEYTPSTTDVDVDFGATTLYPEGTTVTVTVNATPVNYTVTGGDELGTVVAAAMEPSIEALTNIDSVVNGAVITITDTVSPPPTVTAVTDFDDTTQLITTGFGSGVAADDLIGLVVENLTDGSSGTVSDNTDRTLVLSSALTGGTLNRFVSGDICRIISTGTYFVFRPATWNDREVGDTDTNPFPSFDGEVINEVFFYKNRLGFLSDENVILSRSGDLFNFFRETVTDLLDTDPIDVQANSAAVSILQNAMHWDSQLIVSSDQADFVLLGDPLLTPKTARLPQISAFGNTNRVRPVVLGREIYFMKEQSDASRLYRYLPHPDGRQEDNMADWLNQHCPTYMLGSPTALAGTETYRMVAMVTDNDRSKVFVYKYWDTPDGRAQSAFCEIQLPGFGAEVIGIDFIDDNMGLVIKRYDMVTFETMTVEPNHLEPGLAFSAHLDRRLTESSPGVSVAYDSGSNTTTWTLPYGVRTAAGLPVNIGIDTFTDANNTQPQDHTPDLGFGAPAVGSIGDPFTSLYVIQNNQGEVENQGLLQLIFANDLINDNFDAFMDITRGGVDDDSDILGFTFRMANTTNPANVTYVGVEFRGTSSTQGTLTMVELNSGSGSFQHAVTGFPLANQGSIRLGCTVNGTSCQIWTEPFGGGTRTNRGSPLTMAEASSPPNPARLKWGLKITSTIFETIPPLLDNLYVQQPSDAENDGEVCVVDRTTGDQITTLARTDLNQVSATGDFSSTNVWLGICFDSELELSRFHRMERSFNGQPQMRTDGHLQLLFLEADYTDSRDLTITVDTSRPGNTRSSTYSFSSSTMDSDVLRAPIYAKNTDTTITLSSGTPNPCTIQRLRWSANYNRRIRGR